MTVHRDESRMSLPALCSPISFEETPPPTVHIWINMLGKDDTPLS